MSFGFLCAKHPHSIRIQARTYLQWGPSLTHSSYRVKKSQAMEALGGSKAGEKDKVKALIGKTKEHWFLTRFSGLQQCASNLAQLQMSAETGM